MSDKIFLVSARDRVYHIIFSTFMLTNSLLPYLLCIAPLLGYRFSIRHSLQKLSAQAILSSSSPVLTSLLQPHETILKRCLFSRSLRILPLPDQVGIVETLAFLISFAPDVLPLSDQHLLAFLGELLKMLSIADGAMNGDKTVDVGVAVNKNGYVYNRDSVHANADGEEAALTHSAKRHASSIFMREAMVLPGRNGNVGDIAVPSELPLGVQLRVTSLALFRAVVKNHTSAFFEADKSTPIGEFLSIYIYMLYF